MSELDMKVVWRQAAEIESLREALKFYAAEKNWEPTHVDPRAHRYNLIPACRDRGDVARAALHTDGGGDE